MDDKLKLPYQGSLIKFTNVVKGWQTRWFIIDPGRGALEYYLCQNDVQEKARGSISLAGAVISPSDEDSQTFTVSPTVGESYKLRAFDTKNRQMWINRLRVIAEMHTRAIAHHHPPLTPREHRSKEPICQSQGATGVFGVLDVIDAFTQVAEVLEDTQRQHSILTRSIEQLTSDGPGLTCIDPNVLLIKATSQATLLCLDQCLAALRSRHFALKYSSEAQLPPQPSSFTQSKSFMSFSPRVSPILGRSSRTRRRNGTEGSSSHQRGSSAVFLSQRNRSSVSHNRSSSFMKSRKRSHSPMVIPKAPPAPEPQEPSKGVVFEKCTVGTTSSQRPLEDMTQNEAEASNSSFDRLSNKSVLTYYSRDADSEVSDSEDRLNPLCDSDEYHVEDGQRSVIMHIISQLRLGMDLTRVTLPTFILEKRSLLEMFADFLGHPDAFLRIGTCESPRDRMLAVVKWYMTSIHVGRRGSTAKKPYNPIIGEVFNCSWRVPAYAVLDKDSAMNVSEDKYYTIRYTSEQVSHHPPVSAFYFECSEMEMCINAHIWTKSKFMGMSVGVNLVGNITLFLGKFSEIYHLGMPSAYARSVLMDPWVELGGRINIYCPQSGYSAPTIFHTKPFYGGKLHKVTCEVKSCSGNIVCRVQGEWDSSLEFAYEGDEPGETILIQDLPPVRPKRVRPIERQSANESRCLWFDVTRALSRGLLDTATNHKKSLEDQQRAEEQQRAAGGVSFPTKTFVFSNDIWVYKDLPKYANKLILGGSS